MQSHVQRMVAGCFAALRQIRSVCQSLPSIEPSCVAPTDSARLRAGIPANRNCVVFRPCLMLLPDNHRTLQQLLTAACSAFVLHLLF